MTWWLVGIAGALLALLLLVSLVWRAASRRWKIPCPALMAGMLEWNLTDWVAGTSLTLDRTHLAPGQQVLEVGPGPGRLLIPAARRVLPGGSVVGLDLQPKMIARLQERACRAGITNLSTRVGDATGAHFPPGQFDRVMLATVLGEIPDRPAALAQIREVLKPGGELAVTELIGDPHYQRLAEVRRLAAEAGLEFIESAGSWWRYTARFRRR